MRLELYQPLAGILSQPFGANQPCVRDFGLPSQSLTSGADNFTCPAGFEKLYQKWGMKGHNGMDIMAGEQPVYASHDGLVIEQQTVVSRGLGLGIITNEPVELDGSGTHYAKVRYWHLKSFTVKAGESVKTGDVIGITNNTGYSSGNHLHFELVPMDMDSGGHYSNAFVSNGYAGAIDPAPFLNGKQTHWTHVFIQDMQLGDQGDEVKALQQAIGVQPVSGFFGPITLKAVQDFQRKYNVVSWPYLSINGYGRVGPKTRLALNNLFSQ